MASLRQFPMDASSIVWVVVIQFGLSCSDIARICWCWYLTRMLPEKARNRYVQVPICLSCDLVRPLTDPALLNYSPSSKPIDCRVALLTRDYTWTSTNFARLVSRSLRPTGWRLRRKLCMRSRQRSFTKSWVVGLTGAKNMRRVVVCSD
ncbi:hypothetical protein T440DRAFT_469088 [Plenodomus tracheiphilus IPT5]|uniref:Uncharacterized protein n=1 Tax=Plenodomus tracheiphilus IPT5 TaxID=1408161 RepID=A0A6A7B5T7_9PLEO|nr:hypothetical protein T440DRAFT_469088 [Plenodomus tracheiphilus IPT5]